MFTSCFAAAVESFNMIRLYVLNLWIVHLVSQINNVNYKSYQISSILHEPAFDLYHVGAVLQF